MTEMLNYITLRLVDIFKEFKKKNILKVNNVNNGLIKINDSDTVIKNLVF